MEIEVGNDAKASSKADQRDRSGLALLEVGAAVALAASWLFAPWSVWRAIKQPSTERYDPWVAFGRCSSRSACP